MKLSFASLLISASFVTISSVNALSLSADGSDASQINVSGSFAADVPNDTWLNAKISAPLSGKISNLDLNANNMSASSLSLGLNWDAHPVLWRYEGLSPSSPHYGMNMSGPVNLDRVDAMWKITFYDLPEADRQHVRFYKASPANPMMPVTPEESVLVDFSAFLSPDVSTPNEPTLNAGHNGIAPSPIIEYRISTSNKVEAVAADGRVAELMTAPVPAPDLSATSAAETNAHLKKMAEQLVVNPSAKHVEVHSVSDKSIPENQTTYSVVVEG